MDQDLKIYLDGMKADLKADMNVMKADLLGQFDDKLNGVKAELSGKLDRAAEAFATEIGALHTEISELRTDMNSRLDRQGFMLSGGTTALGGLLEQVTRF